MELIYTKSAESDYETVRQVAFNHFEISQKYLAVLKREKAILLNGEPTWLDRSLICGDTVTFRLNESEQLFEEPEKMKLAILYEDELFLAVNKPPFMPVHTSARHISGTLSNGVAAIFAERGIKHKVRQT
jgi:23S rRNA pseudouridine1911/1915/1917 synthase